MSKFHSLSANLRTISGRKVKSLRRQGIVPANLFQKGKDSITIQVESKAVEKLLHDSGETGMVELNLDGKKHPALISEVNRHYMTGNVVHIAFQGVSLKEKVTASISIHLIGESPAVKELGAVLNHVLHEIEIEALPTDLPDHLDVDLDSLKTLDDNITIADVKLPEGVASTMDAGLVIVSVTEPQKQEEEAPAAPIETEVITAKKDEESTEAK